MHILLLKVFSLLFGVTHLQLYIKVIIMLYVANLVVYLFSAAYRRSVIYYFGIKRFKFLMYSLISNQLESTIKKKENYTKDSFSKIEILTFNLKTVSLTHVYISW